MKSLLHTLEACGLVLMAACVQAQPLHVIWDRSGAGDSSSYGAVILPLGDQNNDGYADWAVFATGGGPVSTQPSLLEFFHGGSSLSTQPYMTFHGATAGNWAGVVGDVNGDGYVDWYSLQGAWDRIQRISIYFGGPDADTVADWAITVTDDGGWFGSLGDFNGDGKADVFYYHNNPGDYVDVFYGGSPMDTLPDWTVHSPGGVERQQAAPAAHGDLNGDGMADWISYHGSTTWIFLGGIHPDTLPAYTWPGVGWPTGIVKDLNGDHCDELLYTYVGGADIHYGGPVLHSAPDISLSFPCIGGATDVASGGDFNRDGYNDLLMWTDYCADADYGLLTLHLGHPWIYSQPTFAIEGWTPPLNLIGIWTAAGLGDVNGDSVDDIGIGALDDIVYAGWRGRAIIISGDTTRRASADEPRAELPQTIRMSVYPNPFNSEATIELTVPLSGSPTTLTLCNVLGQEVFHTVLPPFSGQYRYRFDGRDATAPLTTGMYFLRAQSGQLWTTQKLMVLK